MNYKEKDNGNKRDNFIEILDIDDIEILDIDDIEILDIDDIEILDIDDIKLDSKHGALSSIIIDFNKKYNIKLLIVIICFISVAFLLKINFFNDKNVYTSSLGLVEIYNKDILVKRIEDVNIRNFMMDLNLKDGILTPERNESEPKYIMKIYNREKQLFNKNEKEIIKINIDNDGEYIELNNNNLIYKTNNKIINNIIQKYKFTDIQLPIFEPVKGNFKVVEVAAGEIGNVGGEPYWRWYGLNYRIEWCCVFVSWVGYQTGFLQAGEIPKFPNVSAGVSFYKSRNKWQGKYYIPSPGDIIFFDLLLDNRAYHVGIVEKVENGRVYTIEGNYKDTVSRRSYQIASPYIYGYGTPDYTVKKPDYLK